MISYLLLGGYLLLLLTWPHECHCIVIVLLLGDVFLLLMHLGISRYESFVGILMINGHRRNISTINCRYQISCCLIVTTSKMASKFIHNVTCKNFIVIATIAILINWPFLFVDNCRKHQAMFVIFCFVTEGKFLIRFNRWSSFE